MFCALVICLCTVVTLFFILDSIVKNYTTYRIAKEMPGPFMWPIIGAMTFFFIPQGVRFIRIVHNNTNGSSINLNYGTSVADKVFKITRDLCRKHKNGFAFWTLGAMVYHVYSAESFEKVASNPKNIEKSFPYKYLHMLLGTGLLTSTGAKWFGRRKLLTPAFHFNVLNSFQSTFK